MRGTTSGDEFVLAELDLGDQEALQAQADELVRAHHEESGSSGGYQGADASRSVWLTLDRAAKLVEVRIDQNWSDRLAADRFTDAVFSAYLTATRTALLVEAANPEPPRMSRSRIELLPSGPLDDEWEYRIRALLADTEEQLAAIRRAEDKPPTDEEVSGRYGYLTLHLRAGSPAGLTADASVLAYADTERLRLDVLDVFAQAGLGVLPEADEDTDGDFGFEY